MASVQRHKNRWRVKWHVDGHAVYESFATKKEAENAARKIEGRTLVDGKPPDAVDPNALTLARWWERWEPGRPWRTSTRASHDQHWRSYIKPVFGRVPLENITTADVARWHRVLESRGLAASTIRNVHRTLSQVLQGAMDDQLLARNPARAAKLRQTPKFAPVALDPATISRLVDALDPQLQTFARLVAATGLRRSEATGLTWDRVDLDTGMIVVDRQMDYTAPTLPAWAPTKTTTTRRVILTDTMVSQLRAHRAAQPVTAIGGDGLVFCQDDGTPWPRSTLQKMWLSAAAKLAAAGHPLPEGARGWHTLRHSVASRLVESGVPVAEAAEMLGHTPEMLLATYAHVVDRSAADERLRAALDA
jgi:integrase